MKIVPYCKGCNHPLQTVRQSPNSMLNCEQFDAARLGDWFCEDCKAMPGTKYRYFWDSDFTAAPEVPDVGLEGDLAMLRAEVREWLCDSCNTVYPGPPASGCLCVICPKCNGNTGPRLSVENRKLRVQLEQEWCELRKLKEATKSPAVDAASVRNKALEEAAKLIESQRTMILRPTEPCAKERVQVIIEVGRSLARQIRSMKTTEGGTT